MLDILDSDSVVKQQRKKRRNLWAEIFTKFAQTGSNRRFLKISVMNPGKILDPPDI
jgi:hypothetical protein